MKIICAQDMHLIPLGSLINGGVDDLIICIFGDNDDKYGGGGGSDDDEEEYYDEDDEDDDENDEDGDEDEEGVYRMQLHSPVSFTSPWYLIRLLSNRVYIYTVSYTHLTLPTNREV